MRLGARRGGRAGGLLLLLGLACGQRAVPLTDTEWLGRYTAVPTYDQPTWSRTNDYSSPSSGHLALQRAAVLHQQGQLDATVQLLKSVLQKADASHHHGEAYAALAKVRVELSLFFFLFICCALVRGSRRQFRAYVSQVLNDKGEHDLADRAMAKATRIYNEGLAKLSLF